MIISPKHTIGIIGGTGKTGGQFARLFKEQGFTVRVTGSKTKSDNTALLQECDIVIFAVPLAQSVAIIEEEITNAMRDDQLILDVSSLKTKQVHAMCNGVGEVIGMHPLFGPSTDPVGQTIIICPARCREETVTSLRDLLQKMGIRTITMEVHEHDKLMALLQVLPHVKSYLMADVLQKIDGNVIETIDTTATPAYRIELNLVGRFLDDSPNLYGPIILENPDTINMLTLLHQSLGELIQMAGNHDLEKFAEKFESLKTFFGRQTREGREKTEECIKTMINQKT